MGQALLQGVQAVVERQQRVTTERDDDGLSSSTDSVVEVGALGPVGRSATEVRAFHLAIVFGLTP